MDVPADMSRQVAIATLATGLGAVPLLWLAGRAAVRHPIPALAWWMAVGFAVSLVADLAARFSSQPFVSQVYPITQAGIFIALLAPRRYVEAVFAVTLAAASVSIALRHGQGWDVLLRTVAFGTVAGLAWYGPVRWRGPLALYFGGGAVCWLACVALPGWWTWGTMQAVRAAGIGWWCRAAWRTET